MERLVISAPFGNWLNWPHCTSTLGTFTRDYRGGLLYNIWRCIKTLRPYQNMGAWTNKLGLPNPGIYWLLRRIDGGEIDVSGKLVSISARRTEDWTVLLDHVGSRKPLAVEMNVSCPNCGDGDEGNYAKVFSLASRLQVPAIVKLPPVNYRGIVHNALVHGVKDFHCCNTLPTPAGGLSGKPLKALSLEAVGYVKTYAPRGAIIIGGGGVTCLRDAADYLDAGATNVAVASALLNPLHWRTIRKLAKTLRDNYAKEEQDSPTVLPAVGPVHEQ